MTMARYILLAAGSNARGQLGIGHDDDAHRWTRTTGWAGPGRGGGSRSGVELAAFPPLGHRVLDLVGGANHSVALLEELDTQRKTLWVAGDASGGQGGPTRSEALRQGAYHHFRHLPLADLLPDGTGTSKRWPKLVAAGWEATYIALEAEDEETDDVLLALGSEHDFGQLGVSDPRTSRLPSVHEIGLRTAVEEALASGGSRSTSARLEQPGRLRVVALSAGVRHACAVVQVSDTHSGSDAATQSILFGWGAARHGQLAWVGPSAPAEARDGGKPPRAHLTPQAMGIWPGTPPVQVRCGRDHTVILVDEQERGAVGASGPGRQMLVTAGSSRQGQCPFFPSSSSVEAPSPPPLHARDIAAMWSTTLVHGHERDHDQVLVWGAASKGQAGSTTASTESSVQGAAVDTTTMLYGGDSRLAQLVAGSEHALALVHPGGPSSPPNFGRPVGMEVWGWGWTEHGNLPLADTRTASPVGPATDQKTAVDKAKGTEDGDEDDAMQVLAAPAKLWPPSRPVVVEDRSNDDSELAGATVDAAWAGCATSFLQLKIHEEEEEVDDVE